ncbi:sulfite exporter TauE/SafE family protein [Marinospirillum insulare]|uniref:Probable membrane transporter protein n=1 Tax=Marinospirillum insulare TaxID=217169 RepID=A0ABQ5ZWD6_9GAMM|nr:sulfite exporter TauE/SafE family protein [Marinospirillum insulare]GLR63638.1 UPF0721 transmembrane protein [Marinospirillum insulare]
MVYLTYLVLGAAAGFLAGLFGIGGGLIIVAVLVMAFTALGFSPDVLVHLAVGTSLATIIPTSLSSSLAHHKKQAVKWGWVKFITLGLGVGALIGAWTASLLSGLALQAIIGVFVMLVSIQMVLKFQPKPKEGEPASLVLTTAGGVIGWASTIFGIGGGTLSVPFLIWCNAPMRQAVGTSAALGFPIALFGTLGYLWAGWQHSSLPELATGYIYWPALIGISLASVPFARVGAKLAHFLPELLLKRLFALLLFLVGLKLLLF